MSLFGDKLLDSFKRIWNRERKTMYAQIIFNLNEQLLNFKKDRRRHN